MRLQKTDAAVIVCVIKVKPETRFFVLYTVLSVQKSYLDQCNTFLFYTRRLVCNIIMDTVEYTVLDTVQYPQ